MLWYYNKFYYTSLRDLKRNIEVHGVDYKALSDSGESFLHIASGKGEVDVVRYLLEEKEFDINLVTRSTEYTPLHIAAEKGHLELVKFLVEKNADCEVFDRQGWKPIHCASEYGQNLVVAFFIDEKMCGVDSRARDGETPLHIAAGNGKLKTVQMLVEKGADITARDSLDNTAFHFAARSEDGTDIVKYLINLMKEKKNGIDLDIKNNEGQSTLHLAVMFYLMDTVKLLVETGEVDIAATNKEGNTVLHFTATHSRTDMIEYLIEKNQYVEKKNQIDLINSKNNHGISPLHLAVASRRCNICTKMEIWKNNWGKNVLHPAAAAAESDKWNISVVEYLIENADVNCYDNNGTTALHYAAWSNKSLEAISLLLKRGAKINASDKMKRTVVHYYAIDYPYAWGGIITKIELPTRDISTFEYSHPCRFKNLDILKLLVEEGADLMAIDEYGKTVMHYAARFGHTNVIEFLIDEKKMPVDMADLNGVTPLHLAKRFGQDETAELLVEKGADDDAAKRGKSDVLFANCPVEKFALSDFMELLH